MKKLKLTIATADYDHFRDFRTGTVQAEGIEHHDAGARVRSARAAAAPQAATADSASEIRTS